MRTLLPRFEEFFLRSCSYLDRFHRSSYYEGDVGIPNEYKEMRDSGFKTEITPGDKRKRKYKGKGSYIINNVGTIGFSKHVADKFNVDGVNSFFHKRKANVRESTRPQRFCKPPEISTDFYCENQEFFNNFPEFDLYNHITVSGNFETNKHTIQQQIDCRNFSNSHIPNFNDYLKLKNAVRDTIRKLQIVDLGEVNISDIHDFDFDLNTMPGYRFQHYFNATKKSDCVDLAVAIGEERYKKILKATREGRVITRDEIIPGIYSIGARNSRRSSDDFGEVAKSRAVHMPEWHTELHGGIFSDRITAHLVEKGVGPVYIGNSFIKYERLEKQLAENFCAIEGDWSKFDASLCNTFITMACSIFRLYFPPGLLYDNHFLAILDTLVIKDYHVVGGSVLRILHGLPSGSKWTSLFGSVINLLILNYTFSRVKYKDRSFAIGGDDFVVFIKDKDCVLDELEEDVLFKASEMGMKLKYFYKKNYKNSLNIDDYPVFYKYTVFKGKPVTPIESLFDRVFSPWNKLHKNSLSVLKFLNDIMPSLAYPSNGCLVYYQYYSYVFYRCFKVPLSVDELARRHYVLYKRMMSDRISLDCLHDDYYVNKRNVFANYLKITKYIELVFNL
jgi:hypothetical protein